jgi:resuscitation-promoting factor RpfA
MNEADDTPRDEALSRRYREAADGAPPPALDARILAAAQAAVQRPQLPPALPARPWWQRLRLPLGFAATALLATMLSLTVQRHAPETVDVETARPQSAPVPSAVPARPEAEAAREAAVPARREAVVQPGPAEPAGATPATPVPPPVAKGAPPPAVQLVPPSPAPFPAAGESRAPAPAPASAERAMPDMKKEAPAANAVERQEARTADAVTTKPAAAPAVSGAAAKRAAPLSPEAWLDEIRALRRDGRRDEAARRLDEFRRAYPDYPLPADLRD